MELITVVCLHCQNDPRVDTCTCYYRVRNEYDGNMPMLYETDDGSEAKPKWCFIHKTWEPPL